MQTPEIPLVDLKAQYQSIRPEIHAAIDRVLDRQAFINGQEVRAFEEEFARFSQAAEVVAVANGTAALELSLTALGIGAGDEVVTVSHTFFATAEAIINVGAKPVFVDVDPDDWTMAPAGLADAISERTAAIIPVHLYGCPADVPAIAAAAPGIPIIEDAAQAHGARYDDQPVGTAAAVATFSFFPAKNLGAYGDAGAIATNDVDLAARLRRLRDHGRINKYEHGSVGTSSRMDELQAAVLRAKLEHLPDWIARRREIADAYKHRLAGLDIGIQAIRRGAGHVYHLFVVTHPRRDALLDNLNAAGIHAGIHYPVPVHLQPALSAEDWRAPGTLDVSERLGRTVLSLPMYPELDEAGIARVSDALRSALDQ